MTEFRPRRGPKKALQFNLIVVGCSGLGKSTFINTLCGQNVIASRDPGSTSTLSVTPISVDIDVEGIKMQLTIIDTPGFGDSLDSTTQCDRF